MKRQESRDFNLMNGNGKGKAAVCQHIKSEGYCGGIKKIRGTETSILFQIDSLDNFQENILKRF